MLPDLGLAYLKHGVDPSTPHFFYDVPFSEIDFVEPHSYSVVLNKTHNGQVHAFSLDFSDDFLAELLAHFPADVRKDFGATLIGRRFPFRAKLPSEVTVSALTCRLGTLQRGAKEEFVPFIVTGSA